MLTIMVYGVAGIMAWLGLLWLLLGLCAAFDSVDPCQVGLQ